MKKLLLILSIAVCGIANAQYTKLLDFAGATNGSAPGSLISDGTFLYGMTELGGANNKGTLFKIQTDGTGYSKLLDFAGVTNGNNPQGSLISDGTFLYGMTVAGGVNNGGVIFKIKPDGTGYSKLLDFSNVFVASPFGSLISDGTSLYGMTSFGGVNMDGVVFKLDIAIGIAENNLQKNFTIYPNPTTGQFTIEAKNLKAITEAEIYDPLGKLVLKKEIKDIQTSFDISSKPKGIYLVKLVNRKEVVT